jgi:LEA14-like dessication related protein
MRSHGGRRLILSTMMLAGCASLGRQRFQDPTIEVHRVSVREVTLSGGRLDVDLRVGNPNSFVIRATRLQLGLNVAGAHVGDIRHEEAFELPKDSTRMLTLPFEFRWAGLGAAVRTAFAEGRLAYDLAGTVRVHTSLGARDVPFDRDGVVDLIYSPRARSSD